MPQFDNLIGLLGSRSFSTIWFWLVLIGMWSVAGRSVLGIPTEVLARARASLAGDDAQGPAVITLLDWLSLLLPRWQLRPREGAAFLGFTSFLMTSLAVLGFVFWLEMAQALTLLLLPFWVLFWMRVRLCTPWATTARSAGSWTRTRRAASITCASRWMTSSPRATT